MSNAGQWKGAAIGAGAQVGGGLIANLFRRQEAGRQRRFQARMSRTAHQREKADLIAAGINPILTAKYGGATTPAGAQAQIQNPAEGLGGIGSAYDALQQQKKVVTAQVDNMKAQQNKTNAETAWIEQQHAKDAALTPLMMDKLIQDYDIGTTTSALNAQKKKHLVKVIEQIKADLERRKFKGKGYETINKVIDDFMYIDDQAPRILKRLFFDKDTDLIRNFVKWIRKFSKQKGNNPLYDDRR